MPYDGLSKPEDKQVIEVKQNLLESITNTFTTWSSLVTAHARPYYHYSMLNGIGSEIDLLYNEAVRLTRSLKSIIPRSMTDRNYFLTIPERGYRAYTGLFYSALFNVGMEDMVVPPHVTNVGFWGYKIRQGQLHLLADSIHAGSCATGGIISNHGYVSFSFGRETQGGLFINNGSTGYFGLNSDGVYINNGVVKWSMGMNAPNGVFINYNATKEMGDTAKGGLFISTTPIARFLRFAKNARGITYKQIDYKQIDIHKTLHQLLNELQTADVSAIITKVKDIELHCKTHYDPR